MESTTGSVPLETPPPRALFADLVDRALGACLAVSDLARAVALTQRRLAAIYALELGVDASRLLVPARVARRYLPDGAPPTGMLVMEEAETLWVGLYFDRADRTDPRAVIEETSHAVCLTWHVAQGRRVSRLILELQADVDRFVLARLAGGGGLDHLKAFRLAPWTDPAAGARYRHASAMALRYCRSLIRRYPARADTPALLAELRRFYRAPAEAKLGATAA